MIASLFSLGRRRVVGVGRQAALGLVGVVMILPGLALLTHAAWVALDAVHGPGIASLILGLMWLGVGVIFLVFALRRPRVVLTEREQTTLQTIAIVEAFLTGFASSRRH